MENNQETEKTIKEEVNELGDIWRSNLLNRVVMRRPR